MRRAGWVLVGGLIGSGIRSAVGLALPVEPGAWPWPTLTVNLLGAVVLGFLLPRLRFGGLPGWALPAIAIGGLGALTTFSAFSLEIVMLFEAGTPTTAVTYAAVSTVAGLVAASVGAALGAPRR